MCAGKRLLFIAVNVPLRFRRDLLHLKRRTELIYGNSQSPADPQLYTTGPENGLLSNEIKVIRLCIRLCLFAVESCFLSSSRMDFKTGLVFNGCFHRCRGNLMLSQTTARFFSRLFLVWPLDLTESKLFAVSIFTGFNGRKMMLSQSSVPFFDVFNRAVHTGVGSRNGCP